MGIRNAWHSIVGLALCQLDAPRYVFDAPSLQKLVVDFVELTAPVEGHPAGTIVIRGAAHAPKRRYADDWRIVIDRASLVIDNADWHIVTPKHGDGDNWGFLSVIFGIPGLIVSSPVLLPWLGVRAVLRRLTQLDMHQQALFIKLRPQLPTVLQVPFLQALRNHNTEKLWSYRVAKGRKAHDGSPA